MSETMNYKPIPDSDKLTEDFTKTTVSEGLDTPPTKKRFLDRVLGRESAEERQKRINAARNYILGHHQKAKYETLDTAGKDEMAEKFAKDPTAFGATSAFYNKKKGEYEFRQGAIGGGI